jgi:hypothetical protein
MSKIYILLFLLICAFNSNANNGLFTKLLKVNSEWQHYPEAANTISHFTTQQSHIDYIQLHLDLVGQHLAKVQHSQFNTKQLTNRNNLLARLKEYTQQKDFPMNTFISKVNPVFIDDRNVHCAVGYLMQQSGAESLAQAINKAQRLAYIKNIKVNGVQEWANANGFTLDELAWIQPGYAFTGNIAAFTDGVNGEVLSMCVIDTNTILIGGSFSQIINGPACNNLALATKTNNVWTLAPFFTGANGPIYSLFKDGADIYIGGKFTQINGATVNNIARYNLLVSSQPFAAMGSLDDTSKCFTLYNNQLYVGGSFSEKVRKWNGTSWVGLNSQFSNYVYGNSVHALQVFNNRLYIGGDFEIATGALRINAVAYDGTFFKSVGFGTNSIINCFAVHNNNLYAAGEFKGMFNDSCVLYKLENDDWVKLLQPNFTGGIIGKRAKQLLGYNNSLVMVGDFMTTNSLMWNSYNIITIDMSAALPVVNNLSSTYGQVNNVVQIKDELYFGGAFNKPNSIGDRLAKLNASTLPIKAADRIAVKLIITPNPATNFVEFQNGIGFGKILETYVFDNVGKLACNCNIEPGTTRVDIASLSAGQYKLVIIDRSENKTYSGTFIKK